MPRHDAKPGEVASERGRQARRRVVVHAERKDEDELLLLFFCRRGKWAGLGCYSGRGARLPRWADAGLLRCQDPGKVLFSFFSFIYFLFCITLLISVLNSYMNYFLFCRSCLFHSYKN